MSTNARTTWEGLNHPETNDDVDIGATEDHVAEPAPRTSSWGVFTDIANMLKAFIGLNFMYVAYAFAQAGLIRGVLGLCLIALITEHCCLLLIDIKNRMPKQSGSQKLPTFGDIARFAGGRPAEVFVNTALVLTQFGYCVGYLIFISQTVHDLLRQAQNPVWPYVFIPIPILCFIAMLRSIRSLGPFSLFANLTLLVGFLATIIFIGKHFQFQASSASWRTYPLFFGQITAALEGIGLVIPVETSMKDPSLFPFVLRTALFTLVTVLMTVGTLGYMTFGVETKSIILLNFGQSPIVNIVKVILVCGILFTYPLQIFPVFQLAEAWLATGRDASCADQSTECQPDSAEGDAINHALLTSDPEINDDSELDTEETTKSNLNVSNPGSDRLKPARFVQDPWKVFLRLAIVLATALTAVLAGANFGLFQSLVGSMGASSLAYSAPAYFHLRVFRRSLSYAERIKTWLVVMFGVVGALVGTYSALVELINQGPETHQVHHV